jgi:hypothetical protein
LPKVDGRSGADAADSSAGDIAGLLGQMVGLE